MQSMPKLKNTSIMLGNKFWRIPQLSNTVGMQTTHLIPPPPTATTILRVALKFLGSIPHFDQLKQFSE